jgi:hypothetical protein
VHVVLHAASTDVRPIKWSNRVAIEVPHREIAAGELLDRGAGVRSQIASRVAANYRALQAGWMSMRIEGPRVTEIEDQRPEMDLRAIDVADRKTREDQVVYLELAVEIGVLREPGHGHRNLCHAVDGDVDERARVG